MANIKSQKQRVITNEKARLRNAATKSELKTQIKTALIAVEAKADDAKEKVSKAQSKIASGPLKEDFTRKLQHARLQD